jgi:signal peptidase II
MSLSRVRTVLLVFVVALVGCDHYTKHAAKAALDDAPPRPLIAGVLQLTYLENTDSGFGLLRNVPVAVRTPLLTAAQIGAGLVMLLACLRRRGRPVVRLGLALLAAGALGNGIDRLARGYVVDFIHLRHWPVFNVADVLITAGAILLVFRLRMSRTPAAG